MKFVDEFRDSALVRRKAAAIAAVATRPWTIMEVCGGQTHAIVRHGIDRLLPPGITLLHGPGCPVCVTATGTIDAAVAIASTPGVTLCSFGDMLRVPGSAGSLLAAKARGADVRVVYSPLDALALARANPARRIVFFAVGFETTAPASALAVLQAEREGIANFQLLCAHVLVAPAMEALLAEPGSAIQGFLAAGHVCSVMGYRAYQPMAARFGVPVVVTGFEPLDLLRGLAAAIGQLEAGAARVENRYGRAVQEGGNPSAQAAMAQVFQVVARDWRGLGVLPASGLGLAPAYRRFDAGVDQPAPAGAPRAASPCLSGEVLRGRLRPADCPSFGRDCVPDRPLGPTMVSSEGACAAYYRYRRGHAAPPA
jgi:hydrogenase expression/formation protein HypD